MRNRNIEEMKKILSLALGLLESCYSKDDVINKIENGINLLEESLDKCKTNDAGESISFVGKRKGVFARDNGIVLSHIKESEYDVYEEVLYENSIMKSFFKDAEFMKGLWVELVCEKSLYLSVYYDNEFCGYCGVKRIDTKTPEIAIELLKKWHGRGVGYSALKSFMTEYPKWVKVDYFISRVDVENKASIGLMKKLGGKPFGLSNSFYSSAEDKARMEVKYAHLLNDGIRELAREWKVEPQKLLSHVLQFRFDC